MSHPNLTAFPLSWPTGRGRIPRRKRSKFETTFSKARDELFNELKLMGATGIVLSTNVSLRRDGIPYAGQPEPSDPAVAVYFHRKGKDLVFACDVWDRVADNTQAIRKTIEALRGIERWGTGDMVEAAFSGFAALPPAPVAKTWQERFRTYWNYGIDSDPQMIQDQYRRLAMLHHPDRGGDTAVMSEVNQLFAEWKKYRGL